MNGNQPFSILFWLNKAKTNSMGHAPIWVRITIGGRRAESSTQQYIQVRHWDPSKNQATKSCPEFSTINNHLALLQADIVRHYNVLLSLNDNVSAEDVKNAIKGNKETRKTLFQLFTHFKQQLAERKDIGELSDGRLIRFDILEKKVRAFIRSKLKRNDVMLTDLKMSFIAEFEHFLRTVQKIGNNTAMKHVKDFKQVLKYAVMLEYIPSSPFDHFKCTYKRVHREYLTQDELDILYQKQFSIKRLDEVRDCFLFSCYTGYAYSDASALTPNNVAIGIDGEKWIIRNRIKTGTQENIPLLPIPAEIIEKYKLHPYCKTAGKLLPMNTNQRYNSYLKEIGDLCGFTKRLTTHTARHTFATTVLLTNDVPIESVMEMLGHTDIRTTQIYGRVVQKKISNDMIKLRHKLQN